jgi:hypothetical protein
MDQLAIGEHHIYDIWQQHKDHSVPPWAATGRSLAGNHAARR